MWRQPSGLFCSSLHPLKHLICFFFLLASFLFLWLNSQICSWACFNHFLCHFTQCLKLFLLISTPVSARSLTSTWLYFITQCSVVCWSGPKPLIREGSVLAAVSLFLCAVLLQRVAPLLTPPAPPPLPVVTLFCLLPVSCFAALTEITLVFSSTAFSPLLRNTVARVITVRMSRPLFSSPCCNQGLVSSGGRIIWPLCAHNLLKSCIVL